ncbi:MAG: hypothetical protein H6819_05905 [Phycisphaerales bacterium]|nr:hypothetical protein [Phycisphaerales bacterium]MCB9858645.1 hypothetical protein [Phycisphaerales bacterium]
MKPTQVRLVAGAALLAASFAGPGPAAAQTGVTLWERIDVPSITTFFEDVWAFGGSDGAKIAFAVGFDTYAGSGVLYGYDGTSWLPVFTENMNFIRSIWGISPSDVFVVGDNIFMHFDGQSWKQFLVSGTNEMRGVWGSGPSNVFAVGRHGTILHYTGPQSDPFDEWTPMSSGTGEDLSAVSGSGPNDVWAVGDAGTLIHYDGSQWTPYVPSLSFPDPRDNERLTDVFSASTDNVVAVGDNGVVRRFDGMDWNYEDPNTTAHLLGVTIWDGYHAFAVGADGIIRENNGSGWKAPTSPVTSADLSGVEAVGNGQEVFAVGISGVILHRPGYSNAWIVRSLASGDDYDGIWGSSAGDIWVVGANGRIVHSDGLTWSVRASSTDHRFSGIRGTSANDVFATVDQNNDIGGIDFGYGEIYHYDASSWSEVMSTTDPMRDVWASAPNDVYAVGLASELRHFDGNTWTKLPISQDMDLEGIWGSAANDIYLVGFNNDTNSGVVIHYDGAGWTTMALPSATGRLRCVWGSGPADVFVFGDEASLWNFNGTSWHLLVGPTATLPSEFGGAVNAVWGTGPDNVYAVGNDGKMLHYDGSYWERLSSGTTQDLRAIWGSAADDIYAVGDDGIILHFPRAPAPSQAFPAGGVCCALGSGNVIPMLATIVLMRFIPRGFASRARASRQPARPRFRSRFHIVSK